MKNNIKKINWDSVKNHSSKGIADNEIQVLRFMNTIIAVMAAVTVAMAIIGIIVKSYISVPIHFFFFIMTIIFYPFKKKFGLNLSKYYISILPILYVTLFAIISGNQSIHIYFIFSTTILPVVVFQKRKRYLPLIFVNVFFYFAIQYAQQEIKPIRNLNPDQIFFYNIIIALLIFIFNYFMLTFFKNEVNNYLTKIGLQKDQIEEKNKETEQSITYAEKIQQTLLPPLKKIQTTLPKSFVFYSPKDIVSGDFYWYISNQETTHIAVADCTGHGVPGAMVSVVCFNSLNRAYHEFGFRKPSDILTKTNELVIETFNNDGNIINDGMDISLLKIDHKIGKVEFSGANNPLYYIQEDEVLEIKGTKQPIGNFEYIKPFLNNELPINGPIRLFLFSDGYADQFGGQKDKKLKYKSFKKYLLELNEMEVNNQGAFLEKKFKEWKGELAQTDDVCIIGIEL